MNTNDLVKLAYAHAFVNTLNSVGIEQGEFMQKAASSNSESDYLIALTLQEANHIAASDVDTNVKVAHFVKLSGEGPGMYQRARARVNETVGFDPTLAQQANSLAGRNPTLADRYNRATGNDPSILGKINNSLGVAPTALQTVNSYLGRDPTVRDRINSAMGNEPGLIDTAKTLAGFNPTLIEQANARLGRTEGMTYAQRAGLA